MTQSLSGTRSSHRWPNLPGSFDTCNTRAIYPSTNEWGIPDLKGTDWIPARLVAYNDRRACENAGPDAAVHFFLDDYRFETVWTKPERGLSRIQSVGAALTPDFSLWRDMPLAVQLWQVYRSRWCGAWLVSHGIRVITTVSWSTAESYPFAFLGIPQGSVVAVSTVGISDPRAKTLFVDGYTAMVQQLAPSLVLVYGRMVNDLSRPPNVQVSNLCRFRAYETRWS